MSIPRTTELIAPIHPGEMLREEFMVPLGLSSNRLAMALHIPATRILEIASERRGISPDTALRLGRYFGTSAEFWLNLQKFYELSMARYTAEAAILREVHPAPRDGATGELIPNTRQRGA